MGLQSLWKIAIYPQLKVGHWPSDIGGTVGPSQQQLGFLFSKMQIAFMYAYEYIDRVNALKNTWFVLSTSIKFVRNPKRL